MDTFEAPGAAGRLRLLSFNIQAGTGTGQYRDYVTQGWKQVLPHAGRMHNLEAIAGLVSGYDIVGLQEVDDGSLRTGFLNQTQFLAERAGFPFWSHQSNRVVSKLARTCNSLLSRLRPSTVHDHKLPGRIPGRGALAAYYGEGREALMVVVVHLALGRHSRRSQLAFLRELIDPHPHVVVMGDMNTSMSQRDMQAFLDLTGLVAPGFPGSFPSWRPQRAIDHILVSDTLKVSRHEVVDRVLSDHRPVALEVELPDSCPLPSAPPQRAGDEISPQ